MAFSIYNLKIGSFEPIFLLFIGLIDFYEFHESQLKF